MLLKFIGISVDPKDVFATPIFYKFSTKPFSCTITSTVGGVAAEFNNIIKLGAAVVGGGVYFDDRAGEVKMI